jgi:hypothetical protein
MTKIRISELLPGDLFEMSGRRYRVDRAGEGNIYYILVCLSWKGIWHHDGYMQEVGARSQKFVNLISHAVDKKNERTAEADPEIVGPAAGAGSPG